MSDAHYVVRVEAEFDLTVVATSDEHAERRVRQWLMAATKGACDIVDIEVISGPFGDGGEASAVKAPVVGKVGE